MKFESRTSLISVGSEKQMRKLKLKKHLFTGVLLLASAGMHASPALAKTGAAGAKSSKTKVAVERVAKAGSKEQSKSTPSKSKTSKGSPDRLQVAQPRSGASGKKGERHAAAAAVTPRRMDDKQSKRKADRSSSERMLAGASTAALARGRNAVSAQHVQPVAYVKPNQSPDSGLHATAGLRMSYAHRAGLNQVYEGLGLKASVAYVVDQDTQEVLLNKNANAVLPIASITKLMTALVISESRLPLDEILTISEADVDTYKGTGSRLSIGTQLSRGEMLHLALMSSENRAANALGRHYPGGLTAFVRAMNEKAASLGMRDTRYEEPTGLSSRNQSSAVDLARLLTVASKDPLLSSLSTDPNLDVEVGGQFQRFNNTNRLVHDARWGIGVQKTGYISEAGQCLVLQSQIQGRNILMVLLDSDSRDGRIADAQRVREWLNQEVARGAGNPASLASAGLTIQPQSGEASIRE